MEKNKQNLEGIDSINKLKELDNTYVSILNSLFESEEIQKISIIGDFAYGKTSMINSSLNIENGKHANVFISILELQENTNLKNGVKTLLLYNLIRMCDKPNKYKIFVNESTYGLLKKIVFLFIFIITLVFNRVFFKLNLQADILEWHVLLVIAVVICNIISILCLLYLLNNVLLKYRFKINIKFLELKDITKDEFLYKEYLNDVIKIILKKNEKLVIVLEDMDRYIDTHDKKPEIIRELFYSMNELIIDKNAKVIIPMKNYLEDEKKEVQQLSSVFDKFFDFHLFLDDPMYELNSYKLMYDVVKDDIKDKDFKYLLKMSKSIKGYRMLQSLFNTYTVKKKILKDIEIDNIQILLYVFIIVVKPYLLSHLKEYLLNSDGVKLQEEIQEYFELLNHKFIVCFTNENNLSEKDRMFYNAVIEKTIKNEEVARYVPENQMLLKEKMSSVYNSIYEKILYSDTFIKLIKFDNHFDFFFNGVESFNYLQNIIHISKGFKYSDSFLKQLESSELYDMETVCKYLKLYRENSTIDASEIFDEMEKCKFETDINLWIKYTITDKVSINKIYSSHALKLLEKEITIPNEFILEIENFKCTSQNLASVRECNCIKLSDNYESNCEVINSIANLNQIKFGNLDNSLDSLNVIVKTYLNLTNKNTDIIEFLKNNYLETFGIMNMDFKFFVNEILIHVDSDLKYERIREILKIRVDNEADKFIYSDETLTKEALELLLNLNLFEMNHEIITKINEEKQLSSNTRTEVYRENHEEISKIKDETLSLNAQEILLLKRISTMVTYIEYSQKESKSYTEAEEYAVILKDVEQKQQFLDNCIEKGLIDLSTEQVDNMEENNLDIDYFMWFENYSGVVAFLDCLAEVIGDKRERYSILESLSKNRKFMLSEKNKLESWQKVSKVLKKEKRKSLFREYKKHIGNEKPTAWFDIKHTKYTTLIDKMDNEAKMFYESLGL